MYYEAGDTFRAQKAAWTGQQWGTFLSLFAIRSYPHTQRRERKRTSPSYKGSSSLYIGGLDFRCEFDSHLCAGRFSSVISKWHGMAELRRDHIPDNLLYSTSRPNLRRRQRKATSQPPSNPNNFITKRYIQLFISTWNDWNEEYKFSISQAFSVRLLHRGCPWTCPWTRHHLRVIMQVGQWAWTLKRQVSP